MKTGQFLTRSFLGARQAWQPLSHAHQFCCHDSRLTCLVGFEPNSLKGCVKTQQPGASQAELDEIDQNLARARTVAFISLVFCASRPNGVDRWRGPRGWKGPEGSGGFWRMDDGWTLPVKAWSCSGAVFCMADFRVEEGREAGEDSESHLAKLMDLSFLGPS